jgi:hypothetical protein
MGVGFGVGAGVARGGLAVGSVRSEEGAGKGGKGGGVSGGGVSGAGTEAGASSGSAGAVFGGDSSSLPAAGRAGAAEGAGLPAGASPVLPEAPPPNEPGFTQTSSWSIRLGGCRLSSRNPPNTSRCTAVMTANTILKPSFGSSRCSSLMVGKAESSGLIRTGGNAGLRDFGALTDIHNRDEFLHAEVTVRPHDDGRIRLCGMQRVQPAF